MIPHKMHKMTEKRINKAFENAFKRKWKWNKFFRKYKQPSWCGYPDAVQGKMGCWSLVYGNIYGRCETCDLSKYYIGDENE